METGSQDRGVAEVSLSVEDWGVVGYDDALVRQLALHARRVAGEVLDTLVIVSHPPTFTLGRRAPEADIVLDRAELARRGIVVARSDRGGRATYHGPGQVVLYPIVSIEELGLGVKDWVCLLESALIDTLAAYGVSGQRRPATAGIWTGPSPATVAAGEGGAVVPGDAASKGEAVSNGEPEGDAAKKIASLGLRVSRGVSYHGVSLNTGLDASVFDCIVTCGVRGERVTTIETETGVKLIDAEVARVLAAHIARRIGEVRERRGQARRACPQETS
jgi:lipoate-protein ligase B